MNHNNKLIFLFLVALLVTPACDRIESHENDFLTIMPLGDSRVAGNRPAHESYRYQLWKIMVDQKMNFDFIGKQNDQAAYPGSDNEFFDRDHEGTGGARTSDILQAAQSFNTEDVPVIVLLGIGGNDLANGAETVEAVSSNISMIIDLLRAQNPEVTIFIEQIAPGRTSFMTPERWAVFDEFKVAVHDIASTKSRPTSKVIPVDMGVDWDDAYMADNVHYNSAGARIVAERYFDAIAEHYLR